MMDQSLSESDVSTSPSQIMDRLQLLRQLQLLQRGKLQNHRLHYRESPDTSLNFTELLSHFTGSSSYNTFQSLLQSPSEINGNTPQHNSSNLSQRIKDQDLVEGVEILNLSQESECIVNSQTSTRSVTSSKTQNSGTVSDQRQMSENMNKSLARKQISLDEMPILSPKKNFEALILEKLKNEMKVSQTAPLNKDVFSGRNKKPFLRRGEGMSRFGLKKDDLVIQNTKSLPWKRKSLTKEKIFDPKNKKVNKHNNVTIKQTKPKSMKDIQVQILTPERSEKNLVLKRKANKELPEKTVPDNSKGSKNTVETDDSSNCEIHNTNKPAPKIQLPPGKHPLAANKGKSWAAILTNEQNDFLRQLKQSDYYKNFTSPAKSIASDISCDENLVQLHQEREVIEQNMFELLERKVGNASFSLESSFFNRFLRKSQLECSGESTPLVLQKCLIKNPKLLTIPTGPVIKNRPCGDTQSDMEACDSEYTDCDHETSSISTCCSCKTVEETNQTQSQCLLEDLKNDAGHMCKQTRTSRKEEEYPCEKNQCQNDKYVTENTAMKEDMAQMNAKLVATSELLKDRLQELEDEIETFRKENASLMKMREEVDLERQKFYEEKSEFEQKFNEEKILSEYYLAEEKDKLTKQKQTYERYVREMRGRLNKKEKEEVINLKNEISDLKDEIRVKDAKSTSTIARLRNQLKLMDKEKKTLQDEVEKLKKENKRQNHSNEITRRLTNFKYLEQINKKLSNMAKGTQSEVDLDNDVKYKAFEIERQSRSRRIQAASKPGLRVRAKSVPNLKITSRYAKYFSQRDAVSQMDRNKTANGEQSSPYYSDEENIDEPNGSLHLDESGSTNDREEASDNEVESNLEKIYTERFKSTSPKSNKTSLSNSFSENHARNNVHNRKGFFLNKSRPNSNSRDSKSSSQISPSHHLPTSIESNRSKSPVSILSNKNLSNREQQRSIERLTGSMSSNHSNPRSISPQTILINRSSSQGRSVTSNPEAARSCEPNSSKTSLTKTNLNPTEIKRPDGVRELRFPNGNVKYISADGKYTKFVYYNGDVKENFYSEGRIKYYYAETKTYHTTHPDGLEVLEFPDGQIEKRYKDGSSEIRLANGAVRYQDPRSQHAREEWRFPDGATMTVSAAGEQRVTFPNGQVEVHAKDHKRREFPDGTVKLLYSDGASETRYSSGRVRVKDKHGHLILDTTPE